MTSWSDWGPLREHWRRTVVACAVIACAVQLPSVALGARSWASAACWAAITTATNMLSIPVWWYLAVRRQQRRAQTRIGQPISAQDYDRGPR